MRRLVRVVTVALLVLGEPAGAYDGLVEKKVFSIESYTTVGGERIEDVEVGYETYGTLSPERDNAILVAQPFSGTSHAAGRYRESDPEPGYWDSIIGAGEGIDTDRFFVVSADSLANLNVGDPDVVTTGPASIDPATGEPYGLDFPVVTIRDFVEIQRMLLESLGIERIHAVVGASMGAMQALEWAVAYPDRVGKVAAVAGTARADAWLVGWGHVWTAPIRRDPAWNGGDYSDDEPPHDGLTTTFEMLLLQSHAPGWASRVFGRRWAVEGEDPAGDLSNRFAIGAWLEDAARDRARRTDANSLLYLARAIQLFVAGHGESVEEAFSRIDAEVLLLPMASDRLLSPEHSRRADEILRGLGKRVDLVEVEGDSGHADDVLSIEQVEDRLRDFIEE